MMSYNLCHAHCTSAGPASDQPRTPLFPRVVDSQQTFASWPCLVHSFVAHFGWGVPKLDDHRPVHLPGRIDRALPVFCTPPLSHAALCRPTPDLLTRVAICAWACHGKWFISFPWASLVPTEIGGSDHALASWAIAGFVSAKIRQPQCTALLDFLRHPPWLSLFGTGQQPAKSMTASPGEGVRQVRFPRVPDISA